MFPIIWIVFTTFIPELEVLHLSFVQLRDGEDPEGLLKRFQTSMQRSGILRELRNRRFFRSKGEQSRLDKQRSLRRQRRRSRPRT
jgi:ribosomal protein S21